MIRREKDNLSYLGASLRGRTTISLPWLQWT